MTYGKWNVDEKEDWESEMIEKKRVGEGKERSEDNSCFSVSVNPIQREGWEGARKTHEGKGDCRSNCELYLIPIILLTRILNIDVLDDLRDSSAFYFEHFPVVTGLWIM